MVDPYTWPPRVADTPRTASRLVIELFEGF
jgi:hypothetical protein